MKTTFEDLLKNLRAGSFSPVYVLYGKEPLYIDKVARYMENEIVDEANRDFNQAVFYGKDSTQDEVIASAKEFPFGVAHRVVIVKEAQNWSKLDVLKSYMQQPLQSTILVVCFKYKDPSAADLRFFDKHAVVFNSPGVRDYEVAKWVLGCAKEHHFTISSESAQLLADHIGNDLSRIDNEFEKLKLLLPENSAITNDVIEKYIGISKLYNLFELRDALVERNEVKAYKIVQVFAQNINANSIIPAVAALSNTYSAMLAYQLSASKAQDDLRKIFGYGSSPQKLARDARIASGYSRASLVKIIGVLRDIDARAKGIDNVANDAELYKEMVYRILH